ncbi:VRR-NUC domain-containing protein [Celeribacter halophilus]|uniref:VRR-NUC domain-containing protein n=1 Tax=Celeribacter halophilus TaxID=576117 RepID=UPI003A8F134A
MADIPRQEIKLKRREKKRWQFEGNSPKRVELAALDYYRAQGWHGYSTDGPSYHSILYMLMALPSLSKKVMREVCSVEMLMLSGGAEGLRSHPYTFDDVVKTLQERNLARETVIGTLETALSANIRSRPLWLSQQYVDPEEVWALYLAVGKEKLAKDLLDVFPICRRRAYTIIATLDREYPAGKYEKLWTNSDIGQPLLLHMSVFHPEQFLRRGQENHLVKLRRLAKSGNTQAHKDLASEIRVIDDCLEWASRRSGLGHFLDLVLWRDNGEFAYVEVKAPNDRLRPNQAKRIEKYLQDGEATWVLDVKPE